MFSNVRGVSETDESRTGGWGWGRSEAKPPAPAPRPSETRGLRASPQGDNSEHGRNPLKSERARRATTASKTGGYRYGEPHRRDQGTRHRLRTRGAARSTPRARTRKGTPSAGGYDGDSLAKRGGQQQPAQRASVASERSGGRPRRGGAGARREERREAAAGRPPTLFFPLFLGGMTSRDQISPAL